MYLFDSKAYKFHVLFRNDEWPPQNNTNINEQENNTTSYNNQCVFAEKVIIRGFITMSKYNFLWVDA